MIEDRRQRLRLGTPGYGVEPIPVEEAAAPYGPDADRPRPTAGSAPSAGGGSPRSEPGSGRARGDYVPAHGYPAAPQVPSREHQPADEFGYGRAARPRAEGTSYSGRGGGGSGDYVRDDGHAYADDDGLAKPTNLYAALADLAERPSENGQEPGFRPFEPIRRSAAGRDDVALAGGGGEPEFRPFEPVRRSASHLHAARAEDGGQPESRPSEPVRRNASPIDHAALAYGGAADEFRPFEPARPGPADAVAYDGDDRVEWPFEPARSGPDEAVAADGDDRVERPFDRGSDVGAPAVGRFDLLVARPEPVAHRGLRRQRTVVVVAAALGVVMAVTAGYAVLRPEPSGNPSAGGVATAPVAPDEAPGTEAGEVPAAGNESASTGLPPTTATTPAPASTTAPATGGTGTGGTRTGGTATGGTGSSGTGSVGETAAPVPVPTASTSLPVVVPPATSPSAAAPRPLTADYRDMGRRRQGGITGFVGTVRVSNPGDTDVADWTVRLTVPGGGAVTVESGAVSVSQDGEAVAFRPAGTLAANASVTFTFEVAGALPALPFGCTVDGDACS